MNINCTIDSKVVSLSVNSNKPLNLILREDIETPVMYARCRDGNCGNCMVFVNGEAMLSCLIPAFRLKDAKILTFEGYQKTRFWHDIDRAYNDTGCRPCPHCFASKTLIFESLLQSIAKTNVEGQMENLPDQETIVSEIALNSCPCLDVQEIIDIFTIAVKYRRRRRVRRY